MDRLGLKGKIDYNQIKNHEFLKDFPWSNNDYDQYAPIDSKIKTFFGKQRLENKKSKSKPQKKLSNEKLYYHKTST